MTAFRVTLFISVCKTNWELCTIQLSAATNEHRGFKSAQQAIDVISMTDKESVLMAFVYKGFSYVIVLALFHRKLKSTGQFCVTKISEMKWRQPCFRLATNVSRMRTRGRDQDNRPVLFVTSICSTTWEYVLTSTVKTFGLFCRGKFHELIY